FEEAVTAVARRAAALREAGIGHGDLVLVTARTTPPYLLCWLALACLGAVTVPVNPRSTPAELAGLIGQVRPKVIVTDTGLPRPPGDTPLLDVHTLGEDVTDAELPLAEAGPDDLAMLIPTSGTTGRSKLVMQTHRAFVMAGEGF